MRGKKMSQAMAFIVLFGIVSLFSDMTHEGASSIRGAYLALLGASAGTIGFISGLGELVGYSMRYVFGKLTDKSKHYWPMTIAGYVLDVLAVPALALVGEHGWIWSCALLVIQRMGKAIKKPAKDTIMSFAASQEGVGKSFGIQEVLDQIGAFLGPVLLYVVMLLKTDGTTFQVYATCFAVLAIPGAITLILLLVTRRKFPNPEHFEPEPKEYVPFHMKKEFILYIAGISLFAFGFIDYSIIIMHVSRTFTGVAAGLQETGSLISSGTLPLLYAGAMLVDAVAALFFGLLYDKKGVRALVWSTVLSAPFAIFVFAGHSHGGPGVHPEGGGQLHGAQGQPGHGLRRVRVRLRRVLVFGQLAAGGAVRRQHPGHDRRVRGGPAGGHSPVHRLLPAAAYSQPISCTKLQMSFAP